MFNLQTILSLSLPSLLLLALAAGFWVWFKSRLSTIGATQIEDFKRRGANEIETFRAGRQEAIELGKQRFQVEFSKLSIVHTASKDALSEVLRAMTSVITVARRSAEVDDQYVGLTESTLRTFRDRVFDQALFLPAKAIPLLDVFDSLVVDATDFGPPDDPTYRNHQDMWLAIDRMELISLSLRSFFQATLGLDPGEGSPLKKAHFLAAAYILSNSPGAMKTQARHFIFAREGKPRSAENVATTAFNYRNFLDLLIEKSVFAIDNEDHFSSHQLESLRFAQRTLSSYASRDGSKVESEMTTLEQKFHDATELAKSSDE